MNKFDKAAMLFGQEGAEGESGAISNYLTLLSALQSQKEITPGDRKIADNIKERIADEINHLIGNMRDAIAVADLTISADGMREALNDIIAAVKES